MLTMAKEQRAPRMILRDKRNQLEIFKTKKILSLIINQSLNSLKILSRLKESDQKLVLLAIRHFVIIIIYILQTIRN